MPGKVIQGMKKAKTSNPLFLLMRSTSLETTTGDPSSALLEVLIRSRTLRSRTIIWVDYDLSDVMFVTTANTADAAAIARSMEILSLSDTEDEKVEISKRHLIPKQVGDRLRKEWSISDDAVGMIRYYTREAGVEISSRSWRTSPGRQSRKS